MENKKSFILYTDLIHTVNKIPDETAGKLLKHILAYVNDLNPQTDDLIVEVAFEPIKQAMKRDLRKWETEIDRKSQGAILGNLKRWHVDLYEKVQKNEITIGVAQSIAKHRIPSHSDKSDSIAIKSIASIAVSDNVSVSVNDNVSVNVNKTSLGIPSNDGTPPRNKDLRLIKNTKIEDFDLNRQQAYGVAKGFWELFYGNLLSIDAPTVNIEKAKCHEWTREIELMLNNKEATMEQFRTVWDFLKKDDFWKTNCQSVPKLRKKFETIYSQSKKPQHNGQQKSTLEDPEFQAMVMAKFATSPNFQGTQND